MSKTFATVLTTINAPHQKQLDEAGLAACLSDITLAKSKPGHMSSFFGEVPVKTQIDFALYHGISINELAGIAAEFSACSGEKYPLITCLMD